MENEQVTVIENVSFYDFGFFNIQLSNRRSISIPLDEFPKISMLTSEEKEAYEIIDGEYVSFLTLDKIYSFKELTGWNKPL
jgi:hypothetical protein